MDYFLFGGIDSRNYNMMLANTSGESRRRHLIPSKVTVSETILGRSGETLFDQRYGSKEIPLNVIYNKNKFESSDLREFSGMLGGLGTKKLVLSYEAYKYHNVIFDDQLTMVEFVGQGGEFNLVFRALVPFGYSRFTTLELANGAVRYDEGWIYDSGIFYAEDQPDYIYSSMSSNDILDIYHGGNTDLAKPNIIITGSADSIKIEQFRDSALTDKIGEQSYGAFSGTLELNSLLSNVFLNGSINNVGHEGDYPELLGKTEPSFINSGIVESVSTLQKIILSDGASVVDDFYNDKYIYVRKYGCIEFESRKIIDYIGSSRTAIISTGDTDLKSVPKEGYQYNIVNPKDGMNYMKVTGTNFSNVDISFDFRYVYL